MLTIQALSNSAENLSLCLLLQRFQCIPTGKFLLYTQGGLPTTHLYLSEELDNHMGERHGNLEFHRARLMMNQEASGSGLNEGKNPGAQGPNKREKGP